MRMVSKLPAFQSLQNYLELKQRMVLDIETKKLLLRRNYMLVLKCFTFRAHINAGNTWQKEKSPGHCGRGGLLQATIRKFLRKKSTWKFCFKKNSRLHREQNLRKATVNFCFRNSEFSIVSFFCKLLLYVSYKALILILLSNKNNNMENAKLRFIIL